MNLCIFSRRIYILVTPAVCIVYTHNIFGLEIVSK